MFNIELCINLSEDNKLSKTITPILTLSGELKNSTSILNPTLVIESDSGIWNANYLRIPEFGRNYFIKDIRVIRNNLYEITAGVDVLTTYESLIRSQTAIINKQERKWNTYLDDGTFRTYSTPLLTQKTFPSGFGVSGGRSFVLAVSGR